MDAPRYLGKYEIRGTLGHGAMGRVHDGWDPLIARRVAIKTVALPAHADADTADAIARFRREAQAAGRLSHPNIVAIHDYGELDGLAYIVMEFVAGPSLKTLLEQQERLAPAGLRRLMAGLLAGLDYSHQCGVVHRDIKPANIMLTPDGTPKIADFGVARIEVGGLTQAGILLGTPAYMAPEQFLGEPVDGRTDIYAAGVLLYQALTGARPFDGGLTAIMHKALYTDPPPPSQLAVTAPAALDAVVRRAMARRPEDRYPTAAAFAAAITAALDAPAAAAAEATVRAGALPPAPPRSARRWRAGGVVLLLAAVVATLGGLWVRRPAPPVQPPPVAQLQPTAATVQPDPAALRRLLAEAPCAVATVTEVGSGPPGVAGLAGSMVAAALRSQAAALAGATPDWQVQSLDPALCGVLDLLRPAALMPAGLRLALADGRTTLHDGEHIAPRVTMPDFAGTLRVDWFGHDGSVAHLYPNPATPPPPLAAGATLMPGTGTPGQPVWEVAPPYGTDLLVAIASAAPLPLPAVTAEADAGAWLRQLAAAIAAARQRGTPVAAALLAVTALPR